MNEPMSRGRSNLRSASFAKATAASEDRVNGVYKTTTADGALEKPERSSEHEHERGHDYERVDAVTARQSTSDNWEEASATPRATSAA
jgi:hypothetical protein